MRLQQQMKELRVASGHTVIHEAAPDGTSDT